MPIAAGGPQSLQIRPLMIKRMNGIGSWRAAQQCEAECRVFRDVLGDSLTITREEHALAGANRGISRVEVQWPRYSTR